MTNNSEILIFEIVVADEHSTKYYGLLVESYLQRESANESSQTSYNNKKNC